MKANEDRRSGRDGLTNDHTLVPPPPPNKTGLIHVWYTIALGGNGPAGWNITCLGMLYLHS